MRILVAGDSFMPASVFAEAFETLGSLHQIEYLDLDPRTTIAAETDSERRIGEFTGSPAEIIDRLRDVNVLVCHGAPITDEVLSAGEQLKLVCCARGGPVNVDVQAVAARGLTLVTTPGKNAEAVADQTVAFLIMLARRFPRAQRFMELGGRLSSVFDGADFVGHDLGGHTLGLVGFGEVGRRVAVRANSFGMQILVYDPQLSIRTGPSIQRAATLAELLRQADYVSLHARANAENNDLFDDQTFALMKEGSFFVNTARETLVDEGALDRALASGRLAGAALDVFHVRADDGPHPLLKHDNVIMTPHIGGATHETLLHGARMLSEEIERFATGAKPHNVHELKALV